LNNLALQRNLFILTFLLIPVLLLIGFVVYPTIELFHISFTSWNGMTKAKELIGLDNYTKALFDSPDLLLSLKNNAIYFFIHLIAIPIELIVAVMINRKLRARSFYKTVVFLPYIINGVAIAYAFSYIYSPLNGPLNEMMKSLGLGGFIQNWLSNPSIVNYSLVAISLWRYCGLHVVLFLAALQSIPEDLLEAATVDGANARQKLLWIITPMIKTVVELLLFLNLRGALQQFEIPFVLTQGGPGHASSTFTMYSIDMAFKFNNFGGAAAMGVILLLLIVILNEVQKRAFNMGGYK
jgi:ABC-type sugar transport system permease subunit